MTKNRIVEHRLEQVLFGSRWLMAPMYLGLILALLMVVVIFFNELLHYVPMMFSLEADTGILAVLSLIDLTLAANLLCIVIFSGYENFVSRLEVADDVGDRPEWMGTVNFSGLKMKLIASIVAISAIHLLKRFMEIGKGGGEIQANELFWLVVIHLTFVASGLLMAAMDWIVEKSHAKGH